MLTRVADDRARVVREIRAAALLMSDLVAPVTARGPWLTAALNAQSVGPLSRVHPRAVVVEQHLPGRPDGAALLSFRRRGVSTAVSLLGADVGPLPEGQPQSRLYARDDDVAGCLAAGVVDLLDGLRGPWTLRLAGLPLGDPTLRHLAAAMPGSALSTTRSRRLVDELDSVAEVRRSCDPAELERWLPAVLARVPEGQRAFLRAAARLHAAIGQLEVAVVPAAEEPAAVLLTLLDRRVGGVSRWPWWGSSDVGGLRRELGSPWAAFTASAGLGQLGRRGAARGVSGAVAAR
ncbi:MAG: uncharacterized protein JWP68_1240 [Modestobacter sp.]|nr:uncharacterized protein [Modestobacter sp.]